MYTLIIITLIARHQGENGRRCQCYENVKFNFKIVFVYILNCICRNVWVAFTVL